MEPDFERRLILSMSGCSSLSSSPSPIKHSDRFIPLRSLSQPSAFFIDQEQAHKGPMIDKKSSRDPASTTNTNGNSSTNTTTIVADRTKDILTYQALLQNEMFGTQIDSLYDEHHMNTSYLNGNSNHLQTTAPTNTSGNIDTTINGGISTQTGTTTVNGQIHTTSISGINVNIIFDYCILYKIKIYFRVFFVNHLNNVYRILIQIQIYYVHVIQIQYFVILLVVIQMIYIILHIHYHHYHPHLFVFYVHHVNNYEKSPKLHSKFLMHLNYKMIFI